MKAQAETIADLSARCAGPDQFENFDRVFRHSLTVTKAAVLLGRRAVEAGAGDEAAPKKTA